MSDPRLLGESELRDRVERLSALDRGSATHGEREASDLIEAELRGLGLDVRRDVEVVHGGYWLPVGLAAAGGVLAAAAGRVPGALIGSLAAAAVVDDIDAGPRVIRRAALAKRHTANLSVELGPPDSETTVLVVAHYDAAHSGLVFHPELPRIPLRRFPAVAKKASTTPPTMWGAIAGPALAALGAALGSRRLRLAGGVLSAGYAAAMADIALRKVVPGANDNATGVAAALSIAHWLAEEPPSVRVILLFTGSEESLLEGMQRYGERHFARLDRERTHVICVDTVGSPQLLTLEAEGMVKMRRFPRQFLNLLHECADELGVHVHRGLRFRNSTDATVALKAGYPALMIGSVDEFKIPTDYHWPTDTPDRVNYRTVADAARLVQALIRRLGAQPSAAAGSPAASSA
ncbi:MAG: M28 family metallopeptidase [Thermoleophilaceae bacterium]